MTRHSTTDYAALAARHLPPGALWQLSDGYTLPLLLDGVAEAMADADGAIYDMRTKELDPRTAEHTIDAWLVMAGVPSTCTPVPGTLAEKQALAFARLFAARGSLHQEHLADCCDAIGVTGFGASGGVRVLENRDVVWRLGFCRLGYACLGGDGFEKTFIVEASLATTAALRTRMECLVNEIKRATTDVAYSYVVVPV